MVRYLTVALVLLVWGGAGCANKAEPPQPAGDKAIGDKPVTPPGRSAADVDGATQLEQQPATGAAAGTQAKKGAAAQGAAGAEAKAEGGAQPLDPAVMSTVQPLLVQMASDASVERQSAAESLDALGAAVVPYVTALLRTGSESEKRGAAAFLIGRVALDDHATLDALIEALGTQDNTLRHSALQAIEKLPDEQLHRALVALAALAKNAQEESAYRVRAVRAVAKLGAAGKDATPELLLLARDDATPDVQRAAIDAMAKVATPAESEAFFLELLKTSAQKDIRRLAARRLIQTVQSPAAIAGLIAAFDDPDADVRNETITALVAIGRPGVPELIKALDDPNVEVRRRAVLTLGKLNRLAADAVPALQKTQQNDIPEVRALAEASLRVIQGQ